MIVATAGHIDHGKTMLVKALTGVDADRLPEEKRRGMTIDLGFAYRSTASGDRLGFIDVPGHERFIHNMLCGLSAIDFVLFVVAADDGPMPQTREHLAILDLLGVARGAVVLTKIDRVPAARVDEVAADVRALLARTTLASAPLFAVSAVHGGGIGELQDHLEQASRDCPPRRAAGNFRLAVDRSFTIAGAGLVVTGTAVAGSIAAGESARTLFSGLPLRVRAIHAQNAPSPTGRAGQRCALNLTGAGLGSDTIARGDWIVAGDAPPAVKKFDARLTIAGSEAHPVVHWTPVHLHLGATDVTGRIAVLDGQEIAPGQSGLVQLVLDRPIGAAHGDRFIVRDQSARRTLGGGSVVDIFPPARGRARPERLAVLAATDQETDEHALAALLETAPHGVDLKRFAANRNLTATEAAALVARAAVKSVTSPSGAVGFLPRHWDALKSAAIAQLSAWHRRAPDAVGPAADRIFFGSSVRVPREVAMAVVAELVREGTVMNAGLGVRLVTHQPQLGPADAAMWKRAAKALEGSGLRPPTVRELAATVGEDFKKLESLLVRAGRHGLVIRLSENRFITPAALRRLGEIAEDTAKSSASGLVTITTFRDRSAIGRNFSVEVLEFFDRIKFTRRVGEARQILRPASAVLPAGSTDKSGDRDHGKESHPGGAPGLQTR